MVTLIKQFVEKSAFSSTPNVAEQHLQFQLVIIFSTCFILAMIVEDL